LEISGDCAIGALIQEINTKYALAGHQQAELH
jgi:hypothetical protein